MKAIIIGAGSAGSVLAERLIGEDFSVVVIDKDAAALAALSEHLDLLTITGNGADPQVLTQAEVDSATMLLAVTSNDAANLLACTMASNAGVKHRVARIQNAAYYNGYGLIDMAVQGVSLAIDPAAECASEMLSLLTAPLAQEVVRLFDGRMVAATFKLPPDARNLGLPLAEYPDQEAIRNIRFLALERDGELRIPDGGTKLAAGDFVAVAATPERLDELARDLIPGRPVIRKVIIAGGGGIGCALARKLEKLDKYGVVLLENNAQVAEAGANMLRQTLVLQGDMLSEDVMHTAGVTTETAFVTTLEDNEANIIGALLAKKNGACFTIGRVSKLEYLPIINQVALLDRTVNPYLSMINAIVHFIRGMHAERVFTMRTLGGEFHEVTVTPKSPLCNKPIREAELPKGTIIASILRDNGVIMPIGDTRLEPADRLVFYALPQAAHRIAPLFKK